MQKAYKRVCKICGKELNYASAASYWLAKKHDAVCRSCASKSRAKRKCDLSPLLEETSEAYYWIGFLLADGSFKDGRIALELAPRDKEQVIKFANFINWSGKFNDIDNLMFGVRAKHTDATKLIREKFDIKDRKTYNPPKTILNHDKRLLRYLLIGYVDGDGNIEHQHKRKGCFIRIKAHKSWKNILEEFCRLLKYDIKHVRLNKQGYCELCISDSSIVIALKKDANNVPTLKRKWSKIDETYVSRTVTSKIVRDKIIKMLDNNMRNKEICTELKISPSLVSTIKKKRMSRKVDFKFDDASNVFFTSDTHFNHANIIKSCHRPFSSSDEMNEAIIKNWNAKVPTDGLVFHLGDFAWGSSIKIYEELIGHLNGKIVLVKGNHDEKNLPNNTTRLLELFENITSQIYCLIEGRYVYMNHYPFLCYGGVYREDKDKVYQLFGHCHYGKIQTGLDMPRADFLLPTQYDVGVDNNDYAPISWHEVDTKIKEQIRTNNNMTMWWKNNESNGNDE